MSSHVVVRPRPECVDAFVTAFNALAAAVVANEPGAIDYYLLRSRRDPTSFRVVERYRDDDAYQAHRAAPHFMICIDHILSLLAVPPEVEHFESA
ncbi:putative quinol monooxygenase [Sphingomonas profundi]|uniref:putative quinol monooxygenase n=1 Tax=Alterirhizorhabdus profundi TaxID=2681549 RepID=UPI0018D0B48E|nr:putative quinol monooxygenase [Sphingomonas profundi]